MSKQIFFLFFALFIEACQPTNSTKMDNQEADLAQLKAINAQFINNYVTQNVAAHDKIIHKDFVAIQSNGTIIDRATYLKMWATDYTQSGIEKFDYTDELIRIFGNIALVRSKNTYSGTSNGQKFEGATIYTDTYMKENGQWRCIQVQITPIKK
jgi:ketosteroid isomerase-like protein